MHIEFWFEFASTYSYPAAARVDAAVRARGHAVAWRPFLLGPIFAQQGLTDTPFRLYPAKGRYMWRDLERLCAAQGLPFRRPTTFPRSGTLAARVAVRWADAHWLPAYVARIYHANFAEDSDIAERAVVERCIAAAGADPAATLAAALAEEARPLLRQATETAAARGIFGAPSFVVGEELFWGNDRLDAALDWADRVATAAPRIEGSAG